jgi:hypothetical protein
LREGPNGIKIAYKSNKAYDLGEGEDRVIYFNKVRCVFRSKAPSTAIASSQAIAPTKHLNTILKKEELDDFSYDAEDDIENVESQRNLRD